MNNKNFFILISFAALIAALITPRDYDSLMYILQIFMCGGAFYYVGYHFREKKKFSLLLLLMIAIGVLVNPIVPFHFSVGLNIVLNLVAAFVFYWTSYKVDTSKKSPTA